MSITTRWDNAEKTTLIVTVKGKWGGSDTLEQALRAAEQVPHEAYIIIDFRFSGRLPRDLIFSPLSMSSLPSSIMAVVILGLHPPLFSIGWPLLLYAATMQEAKQQIEHLTHISSEPMESTDPLPDDLPDDPVWQVLLQPFRQAQTINLISFEQNGRGVATKSPFILRTNHIYALTTRDSGEHIRIHNNPYVKLQAPEIPSQQLLALASTVPLKDRPHLITAWERRYKERIAPLDVQQRLLWLELVLLDLDF
jgi:hypothetical protein